MVEPNSNLGAKRLFRNAAAALLKRQVRYRFELIDYEIPLLPAQLVNLAANAVHTFAPRLPVWSLPPVFQIEPASACSLRCPLCPTGSGTLGRPAQLLDFGTYQRLIAEVGPHMLLLQFWGWGEPFVNPRAYDMIRLAKDHEIVVVTSTNAQHFENPSSVERLVDCGLDTLIVAVDGVTQDVYAHYRVRGRLDRLERAAAAILEVRERRGVTHPLVNLQFTVMRHNEHQLDEVRRLAERLQVDFLTLRTVAPLGNPAGSFGEFVPDRAEFQRFASAEADPAEIPGKSFHCMRPFSKAMVLADGTVGVCDVDYAGRENFGRLDAGTRFRDVWFSPAARAFRRQFARDKDVFSCCKTCPYKLRLQDECVVEGIPFNPRTAARLGRQQARRVKP